MKSSKQCVSLLDQIEHEVDENSKNHPIRTLNALGSAPLRYRTFGGNLQSYQNLCNEIMDQAFGGHYMLVQLAQCAVNKKILYSEPGSRHTLYCDKDIYRYFDAHGLTRLAFWDEIDWQTLDFNITDRNTDHRIYYSSCKPDAIMAEIKKAGKEHLPLLFIDSDAILKKRHDAILKNSSSIRAAYGHREKTGTVHYPSFRSLHFPEGFHLAENARDDLCAVNTFLMYFQDLDLAEDWCSTFKSMFINNFIEGPVTPAVISRQLLGIDQRTFPIIADLKGLWDTDQIVPFLDIEWDPPHFCRPDGSPAEWHYYTLENRPEHPDWIQSIMHTWISKQNIELDARYRSYQCCLMLEMILTLMPEAEAALRTFPSLKPYFDLFSQYCGLTLMLEKNAVSDHLNKTF